MRDKRPVDELSVEELERVLAIRKRQARQQQLQRMKRTGRVIEEPQPAPAAPKAESPAEAPPAPFELPFVPGLESAPADNGHTEEIPAKRMPPPISLPANPAAPRFDDDLGELAGFGSDDGQAWKRFVNLALLAVEIAAIAGLVYLSVTMVAEIGRLERETQAAQQLANEQRMATVPTPAPTPTIRLQDIVLPGGHTFTADNVPRFNEDEIPAHLLPRVQAQLYQPVVSRPIPTSETALSLSVPALNLSQSIIQGTDWDALREGVGQALNGSTPADASGNVVLAAHNDIYGQLFRNLDQLEVGDLFQIRTEQHTYTYRVTGYDIVEPTDVYVMDILPGRAIATLITCYPYRVNTHRYVVFAERIDG